MKNLSKALIIGMLSLTLFTACSGQSTTAATTVASTEAATTKTEQATTTMAATTAVTTTAAAPAAFKAGTYKATAEAHNGPLDLETEFSDSKIVSVTVTAHKETAGLSDPALTDIPAKIVEKQSLDIDIITGATYTSKAIKYAVADCVKQAGGEAHPLLSVDLDRLSNSEQFFLDEIAKVKKPTATEGVFEIKTYDELKKVLGYYEYLTNPETKEGKFMYVDGSAVDGDTIKLMSDIKAEGDKDNPNSADGKDKVDVVTGATIVVTNDVIIDGNGKTLDGDGYGTFMFAGKLEDFGNEGIVADMKNITITNACYNAKIGGAVFVVGDALLNLADSTFTNNKAGSAKLAFNGGGAIYLNSHGLKPEEGRAILNASNCTFNGNTTGNGGGGALMAFNGDINLSECTFEGNQALSEMGVGGAIALRGESYLLLEDSLISGNEATIAGGGIYIFDGDSLFKGDGIITSKNKATIVNSTVSENKAENAADVCLGRFYSDTFAGDKEWNGLEMSDGNTIGVFEDISFTTIERNVVAE